MRKVVELVRVICAGCKVDVLMLSTQAEILIRSHRERGCLDPKIVDETPQDPSEEGWGI